VRIEGVELIRVRLPFVTPFRTADGIETERDALLVHVIGPDGDGWGECVAMRTPTYSPEWVDGAHQVIEQFLLRLLGEEVTAADVARRLSAVDGHEMAKASLEMAVLDTELRVAGISLASFLGATRAVVPAGIAVGMSESIDAVVHACGAAVAEGYQRIKLKIAPGHDVEVVRAVRAAVGDEFELQVDANGSYAALGAADAIVALARLDPFNLVLVEQPLADDDLAGHAWLAQSIATPVCLDESIVSAHSARTAINAGACSVINLKPGRVGGVLEAQRIHDLCVDRGVGLWIGGMMETGLGRAVNVALAAMPGCTITGDLSPSSRWYHRDITEPFVMENGNLRVPTEPGIGRTVIVQPS
jgi:o-succinylbenzoate synthase